jgi:amidohydrolase
LFSIRFVIIIVKERRENKKNFKVLSIILRNIFNILIYKELHMAIYADIEVMHGQMREWRQHFHRYPETAFEEYKTAAFIRDKLIGFGIEVHDAVGGTGVVGVLRKGDSQLKIALRADMDALFIEEQSELPYKSCHVGKMHACGHDGHSAMLLGAAQYLAKQGRFDGTVYFIFQPAEEGRAGAKRMLDEGLFKRFPAQVVYGMHNFPDIPVGHFAVRAGPMMAAFDCFEIRLKGRAAHAAMPDQGDDVLVAAAHLITTLQTVVSRNVNPAESAVLSVTQVHGGNTWNALPDRAVIRGTFRCFSSKIQDLIGERIQRIAAAIGQGHNVTVEVELNPDNPGYPVTENSEAETRYAIAAATAVVGQRAVNLQPIPSMGSEDFAFMLQQKPGCYIWLGNGPGVDGCLLHNPQYDFNDDILPVGASYWAKLVEMQLPVAV